LQKLPDTLGNIAFLAAAFDWSQLIGLTATYNNMVIPPVLLGLTGLVTVDLSYNNFTSAFVNLVLEQLATNGVSGGTINVSNQTPAAPPTGDGVVAKNILLASGWIVTTD